MSLRDRYLDLYQRRLAQASRLFAGMEEVLQHIEENGLTWGVVTNKPGFLTDPLLDELGLLARSAVTISGDTLPERKPHPQPLLHAVAQIGVSPANSIYVGDDARDIQAGNAAGMATVAALYGFIPPDEDPASWQADHQIEQPGDLLTIISGHVGHAS
jgi:phosphoglycolate phosphatase